MKKQYLVQSAWGALALLLTGGIPALAQQAPSVSQNLREAKKLKVSADLLAVAAQQQQRTNGRNRAAELPLSGSTKIQVINGYVVVEAVASSANATQLLADLQAKGLRDGVAYGAMVSGLFPLDKLGSLEGVASLQQLRPAYTPSRNVGRVTSQGDVALRADVARARYSVSGKRVKVGILSDSYNNLGGAAAGVTSGDLPANVEVLKDLPGGGIDEGRGMAEIIHDVAPDAPLAFRTAFLGQPDFALGIEELQQAGSRVIVDDIIYFAEPFFQNGIVAQAASKVTRAGSLYFSSAGNQGQQSYQATFKNSGRTFPGVEGEAHDFGDGDILQGITLAAGGELSLSLQWDDPFFSASGEAGAQTDLDVYLLFNGALLPFSSVNNNIGGDPFEFIGVVNNGAAPVTVELLIVKRAGPDPKLIKYVNFGGGTTVEYDTNSSTLIGHANAKEVVAVGASAYFNTPLFNPNVTAPVINGFSALGGTPILFSDNGRRLRRAQVNLKPEVTGPDGANTTFFPPAQVAPLSASDVEGDGFPNFFGTSASAPHVAAVAALMVDAVEPDVDSPFDPGLTTVLQNIINVAVRTVINLTAQDLDNPLTPEFDRGFDFKTGFGFVRADVALARLRGDFSTTLARQLEAVAPTAKLQTAAIYPNPSSDVVNFAVTGKANQAIRLTVVNNMGTLVYQAEGTERLTLTKDFSSLPKGLYTARIQVGKDVSTQQFQIR
jgi:hypothetical protein